MIRPRLCDLADLPAVMTVPEVAALLGIGRNSAYEAIRAGAFPAKTLKIGTRVLVSTASLLAVLGADVGS